MLPPELKNAAKTKHQPVVILGDDGELLPHNPKYKQPTIKCPYCGGQNYPKSNTCQQCFQRVPFSSRDVWESLGVLNILIIFIATIDWLMFGTVDAGICVGIYLIIGVVVFVSWLADQDAKKKKHF